jgi:hypothetical protein
MTRAVLDAVCEASSIAQSFGLKLAQPNCLSIPSCGYVHFVYRRVLRPTPFCRSSPVVSGPRTFCVWRIWKRGFVTIEQRFFLNWSEPIPNLRMPFPCSAATRPAIDSCGWACTAPHKTTVIGPAKCDVRGTWSNLPTCGYVKTTGQIPYCGKRGSHCFGQITSVMECEPANELTALDPSSNQELGHHHGPRHHGHDTVLGQPNHYPQHGADHHHTPNGHCHRYVRTIPHRLVCTPKLLIMVETGSGCYLTFSTASQGTLSVTF